MKSLKTLIAGVVCASMINGCSSKNLPYEEISVEEAVKKNYVQIDIKKYTNSRLYVWYITKESSFARPSEIFEDLNIEMIAEKLREDIKNEGTDINTAIISRCNIFERAEELALKIKLPYVAFSPCYTEPDGSGI